MKPKNMATTTAPMSTEDFLCSWGHSPKNPAQQPQTLIDHLHGTALRAWAIGNKIGYPALCYTLGLLHDSGKQTSQFQTYIRSGQHTGGPDHKHLGAAQLLNYITNRGIKNDPNLWALIAPIIGHHGQIPNHPDIENVRNCDTEHYINPLTLGTNPENENTPDDFDPHPYKTARDLQHALNDEINKQQQLHPLERELLTRFLLSALVDADWSDTAEYYNGQPEPRAAIPNFANRAIELDKRIDDFGTPEKGSISELRADFYQQAINKSTSPRGTYDLIMPTGAGKTYAGFGFALNHAAHHNMDRIFIAAPYNNILSQNADTYRSPFTDNGRSDTQRGADAFIYEDFSGSDDQARYTKSHWDNGVVVTSFVKILEMLHSNKPTTLRPLHNLTNSVIILDEIQTLPVKLSGSTVQVLDTLTKLFGCTVIYSTGTNPHFTSLYNTHLTKGATANGGGVRERSRAQEGTALPVVAEPEPIVAIGNQQWQKFENRVRITYNESGENRKHLHVLKGTGPEETWFPKHVTDAIFASESPENRNALIIVNTVKRARTIADQMRKRLANINEDILVICLTTKHTKYDRDKHLARVRAMLKRGEPVIVISTQLIEAGVDVDFAQGWREVAPISSIEQAAGRINREGLRAKCTLTVVTFSEGEQLDGKAFTEAAPSYLRGVNDTKELIASGMNLGEDRRTDNRAFFEKHLKPAGSTRPMDPPAKGCIRGLTLTQERLRSDYRCVADLYRIIPQQPKHQLVCPPQRDEETRTKVIEAFDCVVRWFSRDGVSDKWSGVEHRKFQSAITLLSSHTVEVIANEGDSADEFAARLASANNGAVKTFVSSGGSTFLCPDKLYSENDGLSNMVALTKVDYEATEVY